MKTIRSLLHSFLTRSPDRLRPTSRPPGFNLLEALEDREVPAATLIWAGGDVNGKTDWGRSGNWRDLQGNVSNIAPGDTDTARFTNGASIDCDLSTATSVARLELDSYPNTLTLGANLTVTTGYLKTTTPLAAFSTIRGTSDFVVDTKGTFTWYRGTIAGNHCKILVKSQATLNIESSTDNQMDARIAGRDLNIEQGGTVNFTAGRLFCANDPDSGQDTVFNNAGLFAISGTASVIQAGQPCHFYGAETGRVTVAVNGSAMVEIQAQFNISNTSTQAGSEGVSVMSGKLYLESGGLSRGGWSISTGQEVRFFRVSGWDQPEFTWDKGTKFVGSGSVYIDGARVVMPAGVTVESEPSLVFTRGDLVGAQGAAPVLIPKSRMNWLSGTTSGQGKIQIDATVPANIFSLANPPAQSEFNPTLVGWTMENKGSIVFGKGVAVAGAERVNFKMGSGGSIVNKGGTVRITDTSNILKAGVRGSIVLESGRLEKDANSGDSIIQAPINGVNGSTVRVNPGAKILEKGENIWEPGSTHTPDPNANQKVGFLEYRGTFNIDSVVTIDAGGSLVGSGEIETTLLHTSGSVMPADAGEVGSIRFVGSYAQTHIGSLNLDFAAADHDFITVSGVEQSLNLRGVLDIAAPVDFAPAVGTTFTIVQNNTTDALGDPAATIGFFHGLQDGAEFALGLVTVRITYNRSVGDLNDVILEVVAEEGGGGGQGGGGSGGSGERPALGGTRRTFLFTDDQTSSRTATPDPLFPALAPAVDAETPTLALSVPVEPHDTWDQFWPVCVP